MDSRLGDSTDRQEVAARIEVQRQQLFKASAVIDMCRYACASKLEGFDPEQLAVALHAAGDLICDAAEALELLAADQVRHRGACGQPTATVNETVMGTEYDALPLRSG